MNVKHWLILTISVVAAIAVLLAGLVWWNFKAKRAGESAPSIEVVATGLEIPWAIDFLPDGSIIFTERPGRVRLVDAEGNLHPEPLLEITEVAHRGEGGLLGIVRHPDFSENGYIYIYYTYQRGQELSNKVVRYKIERLTLTDATTIIDDIPGASIHDGGQIKFGPDGLLYITTGDASRSDLAQDVNSLAGKNTEKPLGSRQDAA